MTQTLSAAPAVLPSRTAARPSARATRPLLWGGVVAGPFFLLTGMAQALTRDGFDLGRNALSQLSLGDLGWIQVTAFALTALLGAAGAAGTRRVLRGGPGGTWAPRLIGVFAASFLAAAVFTADPGAGFPAGTPDDRAASVSGHGAVHMASGMVGYLALCAGLLVLARHFAARQERGWAIACRLLPAGVVAGFAGSAVSVPAFTAGAALGLIGLSAVTARLMTRTPEAR
ncbi:DUF998 domain-containing protein [Streptomyces sp. RFCAC02]|uniref:DUF998 domain-containing protein n=1 Tax=Streptomyces sp. RFCAC02 TaxID=2499143 RepID=UPI00101E8AC3|nr:DUF998 domain-containing protein [Streptomyces sp. RFCAC02]